VAVIGDVVIEGFSPEICLGLRDDREFFAGLFRGGGLVKPFHFGKKSCCGSLYRRGRRTLCGSKRIDKCVCRPQGGATQPGYLREELPTIGLFILCSKKGDSRLDGDGINCAHSLQDYRFTCCGAAS